MPLKGVSNLFETKESPVGTDIIARYKSAGLNNLSGYFDGIFAAKQSKNRDKTRMERKRERKM